MLDAHEITYLKCRVTIHVSNPKANVLRESTQWPIERENGHVDYYFPVMVNNNDDILEFTLESSIDFPEITYNIAITSSQHKNSDDICINMEFHGQADPLKSIFSDKHGIFERDFSKPQSTNVRTSMHIGVLCGNTGELKSLPEYLNSDGAFDITTDEGVANSAMLLQKALQADAIDITIDAKVVALNGSDAYA